MLALLSLGTVINYLDRAVLGIAAPSLSAELGISAAVMGVVFSAFSWTYTAAQIPGGRLLDRFGTRWVYFVAVTGWSLCTLLQGFTAGLVWLLLCRLGLGVAEAPCFPANSRVLRVWFPQRERARANATYAVGQYVGLAFLSPLLFWVAEEWGWRCLFVLCGCAGLIFAVAWLRIYREPWDCSFVSAAERNHIAAGGGLQAPAPAPFVWADLWRLLRKRQILGAAIGQFCGNATLVFFLTWFPTYLARERHLPWLTAGAFAVLPYIAASVGVLAGGWLSDHLIIRGHSPTVGRKLPVVAGLLLASTIMTANLTRDNVVVVAVFSVAFFGQGMVNLGWTLITDIAPPAWNGLAGGLFNMCANLAGIVTPTVIGLLVGHTGSFVGALVFMSALSGLGAISYVFILGEVRPVQMS